jgi:hypothetical protein
MSFSVTSEDARPRDLQPNPMTPNSIAWQCVPLYWLATGRALNNIERLKALDEYRDTDGMYMVVMEKPTGNDSPEECERLSDAGVTVEEIDWTGFDAALAASKEAS